tara:strand:+ start:293 stop:691 length:399 start_codon:yes stop_codon:yes gene_type:complete
MAKKHANKKPKKKGKVIKMANENKETPKQPQDPKEALNKLIDNFKAGSSEEKDNIVFNMAMRLGQALDGLNARMDMIAGILYQLPEVKGILEDMKKQQEEQIKKQKEGDTDGQPESKPEPELSKEGATSESE